MTLDEIEERLHEAITTLAALPDRERRWLKNRLSAWPEPLREAVDIIANFYERKAAGQNGYEALPPPRVTPSAEAITRMDETLPWLQWLDDRERRILAARAFGISWVRISFRYYKSDVTVQRWYKAALLKIARKLGVKAEELASLG